MSLRSLKRKKDKKLLPNFSTMKVRISASSEEGVCQSLMKFEQNSNEDDIKVIRSFRRHAISSIDVTTSQRLVEFAEKSWFSFY